MPHGGRLPPRRASSRAYLALYASTMASRRSVGINWSTQRIWRLSRAPGHAQRGPVAAGCAKVRWTRTPQAEMPSRSCE